MNITFLTKNNSKYLGTVSDTSKFPVYLEYFLFILYAYYGDNMSKVCTNISLDSELKTQAQELMSALGLDLSSAITLFLKQAVREQRIPFEIRRDVPNKETIEALN